MDFTELQSVRVIRRFAEALVQANSVEDVLWTVAKDGIAPMGLQDCVVYLVDPASSILVQRAAHGPKNPQHREIFNPILIPLGKGIVGTVAQTGKAELILDTRRDQRYILDDQMRLSELTVPIVVNGRVVGIIDSEHPDPNFYNPLHLETIQTLATLASSKMGSCLRELRQLTEQITGRNLEDRSLLRDTTDMSLADMKSRFIGHLNHEIRTPLNGVLGMSEVLLLEDRLAPDHREMVETIHESGVKLLQTLSSLLEYSEISTTGWQAKYGPVDLTELLAALRERWQLEASQPQGDLDFHVDGQLPSNLWGDQQGISQILLLLLKNLSRARPGMPMAISARLGSETQGDCSIEYRVGFKTKPSRSAVSADAVSSGFDLSLAIAGRIATALGGRIFSGDPTRDDETVRLVLPLYRAVGPAGTD